MTGEERECNKESPFCKLRMVKCCGRVEGDEVFILNAKSKSKDRERDRSRTWISCCADSVPLFTLDGMDGTIPTRKYGIAHNASKSSTHPSP